MMTAEIVTPSDALGLLSSMYLCKPSLTAINNWKTALSADDSIYLQAMKEAIMEINTESKDELEELLWDYTRLFIGPYKLPCPPWESVYTSPKRLMMQDAADQVLQLYREVGLSLKTPYVMPDHIGTELNFLALLLQKSNSATDDSEKLLRITDNFLNDHILKWVPDFTRDMENAAETRFYKSLADVTGSLVDFIGR
jgi:TorA maturation chaperone TorD